MEKKIYTEKNINENVKKYISFQKYILTQKMFVLQKRILSFYQKNQKNLLKFVVNSIIWSVKFRKQSICGIPYTNSSQKHKGTS